MQTRPTGWITSQNHPSGGITGEKYSDQNERGKQKKKSKVLALKGGKNPPRWIGKKRNMRLERKLRRRDFGPAPGIPISLSLFILRKMYHRCALICRLKIEVHPLCHLFFCYALGLHHNDKVHPCYNLPQKYILSHIEGPVKLGEREREGREACPWEEILQGWKALKRR